MDWSDERWKTMKGGYRVPFDPRPHLLALKAAPTDSTLWDQLIQELYHQGDVGEASYAAVIEMPRLVAIHTSLPWQLVAFVLWIDLARGMGSNPPLTSDLEAEYAAAIESLARRSLRELAESTTTEANQCMLGLVALWKGERVYAKALVTYSEEELDEFLPD